MSGITIKTSAEIKKLRAGGKILAKIIKQLGRAAKAGTTTLELDSLARKLILDYGATPSFENFGEPPYPAVLCASNNEGIVHCIPDNEKLKEGDILGLDLGIWYQGLCTDMAITVPVGKVSAAAKKLLKVTQKSLELAIQQVKPDKTIGDIGYAVQTYVEQNGFGVVRRLVGHGVGYGVHEEPRIPNFGKPGQGQVLKEGMVIAIEPMVTAGHFEIEVLANNWNIVTADRSLAAHFEHTVAVTKNGCEILTRLR
ncbi:MAG: type I methionyl aminopeptidase [Candidatus Komeilibacteria bacterium]|nr:type I methionyl aminopeptidase [Candidatus Komeilibacteria bacterium]